MKLKVMLRLAGISGVDGSGKSTLLSNLGRELEAAGQRPVCLYLYGCVVCRNWSGPLPSTMDRQSDPSRQNATSTFVRHLHSYVDLAEITLRLLAALLWALRHPRTAIVITDRSPLDGLVKHDPTPGSLAARWYVALAKRYQILFWLDGDISALAERDREHTTAQLGAAQVQFRKWSARLPAVTRVDATAVNPSALTNLTLRQLAEAIPF